jgi:glycosyltransferase involved in cell wall biosynthesis
MTTMIASTCATSATNSCLLNLTKVNCNLGFATKNGSNDREPAPPLVSIVMAVYNQERYLAQAIASVIGQTYTNFELIIWNDGSSDRSLEIAQEYAAQNQKIRVIDAPHQGAAASLKGAYAAAKGIYLGQVDSDDILNWRALEQTVPILEAYPAVGMVYTNHLVINAGGKVMKLGDRCSIPYSPERMLIDFMTFHFRLMRRSVYQQVGGIHQEYDSIEDYDLCLRLSEVTEIWHLPEPLYYYREHSTNTTNTRYIEQLWKTQQAINVAIERRGLTDRYRLRVQVQARFFIDEIPTQPQVAAPQLIYRYQLQESRIT